MEEKRKPKGLLLVRKVRPKYNKLLIPALIVSLIIAVILILILRKYLIKPLLEEQGLFEPDRSVVMLKCDDPYKAKFPFFFQTRENKLSITQKCRRKV
jgi:hypothetical protein